MHSVLNNLQAKVNALPALCYSGRLQSLEGELRKITLPNAEHDVMLGRIATLAPISNSNSNCLAIRSNS